MENSIFIASAFIWPSKKTITFSEADHIRHDYTELPFETEEAKAAWRGCNDAFMVEPWENGYERSTMVVSNSLRAWRYPTINEYYGGTLNKG